MPRPEPTGCIKATFENVRGTTQLRENYGAAPLKIAKTFALPDGQAGVCIMDSSPGLLAGDCYHLEWHLKPSAHVFLTNQTYTKIHPSRTQPCSQFQHIKIEQDALLEYLPEPVMLYQDAAFSSECRVELQTGATLLLSDIFCAGRVARGEAFQFYSYANSLLVRYGDELIFCNRTQFAPATNLHPAANLRRLGAFGTYTHWGSFYVFSDRIQNCFIDELRQITPLYPQLMCGISLTYRHGLAVSILGNRAYDIQHLIRRCQLAIRQLLS